MQKFPLMECVCYASDSVISTITEFTKTVTTEQGWGELVQGRPRDTANNTIFSTSLRAIRGFFG